MNRPKLTVNPNRIDLDEAYMQMAEVWAKRSKANRLQVGCIIVKDQQIISDGYNGMPAGLSGEDEVCEEYAHPEDYDGRDGIGGPPDPIVRTKTMVLHAEANALMKLAKNGGKGASGATLYTVYSPCPECAKLIKQANVEQVYFRNHYRLPEGVEILLKLGVRCHQLPPIPKPTEAPALTQVRTDHLPRYLQPFTGDFKPHHWEYDHSEPGHQTEPIYKCADCGEYSEVPVPKGPCTPSKK